MKSPRYRPRWASVEEIAAEHRMRKRIRDALADRYPDNPRPDGRGWLVALAPGRCLTCTHYVYLVQVPGFEFVQIAYCRECETVLEPAEPG